MGNVYLIQVKKAMKNSNKDLCLKEVEKRVSSLNKKELGQL